MSPVFSRSKVLLSKNLSLNKIVNSFTNLFTFVLVSFLLTGQVSVVAFGENYIFANLPEPSKSQIRQNQLYPTETITSNTSSQSSILVSNSSTTSSIALDLGLSIQNISSSISTNQTYTSVSSNFQSSSIFAKIKSKTDTLPRKINLLKNKKLLNFQNGVNVKNDWWLEGVSGNNTKEANAEINTFLDKNKTQLQTKTLPKVKLAIIDSGIDTSFVANSKINFDVANSIRYYSTFEDQTCDKDASYLPIPEIELDLNGNTTGNLVDSTINFYCRNVGSQFDNEGHGTAVAYIAGQVYTSDNSSLDNSIEILPIAMHGYALDTFMLADAIIYATNQGSSVINMSIGSPFKDNVLKAAIRYAQQKGVIIVASSGNCGIYTAQNCDTDNDGIQTQGNDEELDNAPNYPASYTDIVSVGASNYKANCPIELISNACPVIDKSNYSNSANNLFVLAPVGNGIEVPSLGEEAGTSFSAPQVAGAIVKFMAIKNLLTGIAPNNANLNVLNIIKSGATDIVKEDYTPGLYVKYGWDYDSGNGLLNTLGSWKLLKQEFDNLKQTQSSQISSNNLQPSGGVISITNIVGNSPIPISSISTDQINRIQYRLQGIGGAIDPNLQSPKINESEQNKDITNNIINLSSTGKGSTTVRTGGYFP